MASSNRTPPSPYSSPFPFATAPDIIRAHQKDAYFQGLLTNQLTDLHRRLLGVRSSHAWANATRTAAELLYHCLTTLIGNRTLGEEYCDLIQVEAPPAPKPSAANNPPTATTTIPTAPAGGPTLPTVRRRGAYIALSILLPHLLTRLLPRLLPRLRARLEARLAALHRAHRQTTLAYRAQRHALAHLASLTSGAPLRAAVRAAFYFSGAYYSLAKRATRLRYVFTRRRPEKQQQQQQQQAAGAGAPDSAAGAGYEVLGVLLVVQLAMQTYLHVRRALAGGDAEEACVEAAIRERAWGPGAQQQQQQQQQASLPHGHSYSGSNDLLLLPPLPPPPPPITTTATTAGGALVRGRAAVGQMAHTPVAAGGADAAHFDLRDGTVLGWIKGRSQRKCTLCLDELRDPSATGCGHVFCWSCIGDWVHEKPECPLCRREVIIQHILPLRVV